MQLQSYDKFKFIRTWLKVLALLDDLVNFVTVIIFKNYFSVQMKLCQVFLKSSKNWNTLIGLGVFPSFSKSNVSEF